MNDANAEFSTWGDITGSSASTVFHEVPGLTNGTEYTFEVRSIDSDRAEGDQAGPASSATATPTTAARAPSQMSNVQHTVTGVTGGSGGTVTFTWDDPGETFAKKYEYRYKCHNTSESCDNSFDTEAWQTPDNVSTVVVNDKFEIDIPGSNSASVYFQLRAVNTTPDPDLAGEVTAVTVSRSNTPGTSPAPPAAPANVSISTTSTTVTVSWDKPSVTTNIIWQRQQSHNGGPFGDWEAVTTTEASDRLSFAVSSASGTYAFKIRAVDNKGNDDDSDDVNGAVATTESATAGAPNAPTGLSATPTDDTTTDNVNEAETQIVLSWTAGADITGVEVDDHEYRMRVGGTVSYGEWMSTGLASVPTADNPFTVIVKFRSTTYYFQVRAVAGSLESDPSNAASGTTADPPSGETIDLPAAPTGLRASAGDEQVTLNWSHPNTDEVKWYRYRQAEGDDASSGEWQQVPGTGATMTHTIMGLKNGTTYSFQVQAVGAGDNNLSDPSNTATATPRVPPPPTGGGGPSGPQRDSVTAHNSDETIDVTIEKPASVTLDVAVVDQACNTAAPGGSVHLCVQASASGSGVVDSLKANLATMTIVISQERWIQMEGAYNADPRRFFLSKRSSPVEAWANIAWCLDDPAVECYRVVETEQAGATVYVRNIVSFSQYAIRTVVVGGGAGARCVGINCRAVIIGGGGGTGRGPQHRLPATTRTPAPTPRPTVAPTVRPTVVPPTVTPTAVPPTSVPPTRVPSTALPPTPAEAPTPPVQVEAPTPPPPTPVDTPTPEPTEVTAALPPTAVAPAPTPIPPLVGEPEGNLPPWLLIVIIAAVLAVGGMGFLAFRLLRAQ